MASIEQVEEIFAMTRLRHQKTPVGDLNRINMGIGAVLRCLNESEEKTLTARELSRMLGVSSARIAAILGKMLRDNLIEKRRDIRDARVVTVHMTKQGEEVAEDLKKRYKALISKSIDRIGYERMYEFVTTINDLCEMVDDESLCCTEANEQTTMQGGPNA